MPWVAVVGVVTAPGVFALVADGEGPFAWEAADHAGEVFDGAVAEEADCGGGHGFIV